MITSNRRSTVRPCNTSTAAVAVLILLTFLHASFPAVAQTSGCDCSCESYAKLMQVMETYQAQQNSRTPQSIPPEVMQMGMCAGQCAMKWAQCQNPDLDLSEIQRARGAAQQEGNEYSGDNAIARERAIHERGIGETEKNLQSDTASRRKDDLTADYLEGMWCSVYGGQETSQWRFTGSGSYEIGLPGGTGYVMQGGGDSVDEFHDRFENLVDRQADTFTTEHRHGRNSVFTRGPCK